MNETLSLEAVVKAYGASDKPSPAELARRFGTDRGSIKMLLEAAGVEVRDSATQAYWSSIKPERRLKLRWA